MDMGGADDVPLVTCDESTELCSVANGFDNEDDVPNPTLGFDFSPLFPVPPKLNLDAPVALVLEDVCDPNTLGAFVDMGGADDVPLVTCDESNSPTASITRTMSQTQHWVSNSHRSSLFHRN